MMTANVTIFEVIKLRHYLFKLVEKEECSKNKFETIIICKYWLMKDDFQANKQAAKSKVANYESCE
ncbi:hypothetical protein T01_2347 [Trichinella spiralis]|uniref:Uncharacterized protein n=1 Tax=Trichinella spiralis TaxID=6334 RepID=A0A0V1C1D6_TRISP|nr:hypothetical protein T01_2347 [Trichinella spiralis]